MACCPVLLLGLPTSGASQYLQQTLVRLKRLQPAPLACIVMQNAFLQAVATDQLSQILVGTGLCKKMTGLL